MIHVTTETMWVDFATVAGDSVLAGASDGASAKARVIDLVAESRGPIIVLDFSGVSVATSSFLREAVLRFRDFCRQDRPELYPVAANMGKKVLEEFVVVLAARGDAFPVCEGRPGRGLRFPRVIGTLDEKQRVTLEAVLALGNADAASLKERFPDDRIGLTGWSNRLAALASKSILRETRVGRSKLYVPVLEGLSLGS